MARLGAAILTLAILAARASSSCVPKPRFQWDEIKYLVAFGDSYTFVQGTAGYPKYSFIGSYLPGEFGFSPEKLLSNKIVQNFTGTANAGPNWVEVLTGCGTEPGETSPLACDVQLWDFAFAGADVSEEFLPLHHDYTVPLVNQTQQYLTWAEPVVGRRMDKSKALVAIWIGINDINDSSDFTGALLPKFYNTLINAVFKQSVKPMYEAGYKNFLFINLPPLDRTAANVRKERPLPNKTMIGWWNKALERHRRAFQARNRAAETLVYDANSFLNGVLDDPEPYGIKNTTSFCPSYAEPEVLVNPAKYGCQPLDEYFWYNSGHMGTQAHKAIAADLVEFLKRRSAGQ
ncbi:hypothetical protein DL764_000413 [Monosporascus ibericus]|uniref:SGNH hydrolase-type esterase domain-containing protein n=1 Tax=Monosporascus ibericus TaxID=155417 RepID=A0A4Q4TTM1_9PEZI|nr:hypothetical protein DL764_000413 [Monosporascus ibericus]